MATTIHRLLNEQTHIQTLSTDYITYTQLTQQ